MREQSVPSSSLNIAALSGLERRAWVRYPSRRRIDARRFGTAKRYAWEAIIRDVTPSGLGLVLPHAIRQGAILVVEPRGRGLNRLLLARVVHVVSQVDGWLHGCELANPLTDAERRDLL